MAKIPGESDFCASPRMSIILQLAFLQFPNVVMRTLPERVALIYERGLFVLDNLYTSPRLCCTLSELTPWLR